MTSVDSIVRVGYGRGFVVAVDGVRYVVTAAHCLPHLPPAASITHAWERSYAALLAPLGDEPCVAAECAFVDPVADIAVVQAVDGQMFVNGEDDEYEALVDDRTALRIAAAPLDRTEARREGSTFTGTLPARFVRYRTAAKVFSLALEPIDCELGYYRDGPFTIEDGHDGIAGGMSGSPIIACDGCAVGVVVTNQGPHPRLTKHLPGWLVSLASKDDRLDRLFRERIADHVRTGSPIAEAEQIATVEVYGGDTRITFGTCESYPDDPTYLAPEALAVWMEDPLWADFVREQFPDIIREKKGDDIDE